MILKSFAVDFDDHSFSSTPFLFVYLLVRLLMMDDGTTFGSFGFMLVWLLSMFR